MWRIQDTTNVPADAQQFMGDGQAVVRVQALRELGAYLAGVRELIAAQRTCIEARSVRADQPTADHGR